VLILFVKLTRSTVLDSHIPKNVVSITSGSIRYFFWLLIVFVVRACHLAKL